MVLLIVGIIYGYRALVKGGEGITEKDALGASGAPCLFVAGVEGTGHHLVLSVAQRIDRVHVVPKNTSSSVWSGQRFDVETLTQVLRGTRQGKACFWQTHNMYSYPHNSIKQRSIDPNSKKILYPDLTHVQQAADRADRPLRVLLLERDRESCINSAVRRGFAPYHVQSVVHTIAVDKLRNQLAKNTTAEVVPVQFDDMVHKTPRAVDALAHFFGTAPQKVRQILDRVIIPRES